jgi:MoxR-like ATPase
MVASPEEPLTYRKTFDPPLLAAAPVGPFPSDSDVYVFDDDRVVLAVNVALSTGRPLLVFGPPGSGKSALGPNIARVLGWPWRLEVVNARTEPEDLLWHFDALRRLNDAQGSRLDLTVNAYYTPGLLWNAFVASKQWPQPPGFVAIIDEIDKADPDVPSALLKPLGSLSFDTPWAETVSATAARPPLIVITTNDERQLSGPFLRRCVTISLENPDRDHLLMVARCHLGDRFDVITTEKVVEFMERFRDHQAGPTYAPSTAEFLDTLKACVALGLTPTSPEWDLLTEVTLRKRRDVTS